LEKAYKPLIALINSLKEKNIYTFIEIFILQCLTIHIKQKENDRRRNKYTIKLLKKINSEKFNNKINHTFQQ